MHLYQVRIQLRTLHSHGLGQGGHVWDPFRIPANLPGTARLHLISVLPNSSLIRNSHVSERIVPDAMTSGLIAGQYYAKSSSTTSGWESSRVHRAIQTRWFSSGSRQPPLPEPSSSVDHDDGEMCGRTTNFEADGEKLTDSFLRTGGGWH